MTGRTHYKTGVLYYLLLSWLFGFWWIPLFPTAKVSILGMLAAAFGALFPDADQDHSLINTRNPVFRASNKTIDGINRGIKRVVGFLFFAVPAGFMLLHMYRTGTYTKEWIFFAIVLFFFSFHGLKIGPWFPLLSGIFHRLDRRANKIKKVIMICVYLALAGVCLYYGYTSNQWKGIVWGVIFILVALFSHRTVLHAPEGMLLVVFGFGYVAEMAKAPELRLPFAIGYVSHLYLADMFTNSGVPYSSIPLLLKKSGLHERLRKYKGYRGIYKKLNGRFRIPLMSTGSKWGGVFETLYVLVLLFGVVSIYIKDLHMNP